MDCVHVFVHLYLSLNSQRQQSFWNFWARGGQELDIAMVSKSLETIIIREIFVLKFLWSTKI